MSLILIGTILSGLILSKLLLILHVDRMLIRYPLVVILSYLCFFIFIRLWLSYIRNREKIISNTLETTGDLLSSVDGFSGKSIAEVVDFGGGQFGGGGASGSFGDFGGSTIMQNSAKGLGEAAGEAGASLFEFEEGGIILIPLMIVLSLIFGVTVLLIYQAPFILTEAAFEFVLAGALIKKAKELDSPYWIGSVFANTWKPFVFTFLLVVAASGALSHYFPEAVKITQIIK
jgi:hypothetical protein